MNDTTPEPTPDEEPVTPRVSRKRGCIMLLIVSLVIGFVFTEITLRVLTTTDKHGVRRVLWVVLTPYPKPQFETEPFAEPDTYIAYDPHTGWAPRPLSTSKHGLYHADQFGLRAPSPEPRTPPEDEVRIMLTGDSFAHSDEIEYDGSLGHALEGELPGTWVQIAGVPAFGTDQAYLRYLALRDAVKPQVVIIGVHQNDFERNVRVFNSGGPRGGGLPFSKPRWLWDRDTETFELVNFPPLRGNALRDAVADFENGPLRAAAHFHVEGVYDEHWSDVCRTIHTFRSFLDHQEYWSRYRARHSMGEWGMIQRVTNHVVGLFARDVKSAGGVPVVVTFPARWQFDQQDEGLTWWDDPLRSAAGAAGCEYVDLTPVLLEDCRRRGVSPLTLFTREGMGHYTPEANRRIAEILRPTLESAVRQVR